jgi:very-short-patch-repair endonuclease
MRKKLHAGKASAPMNRSNRPMSNLEQQIADMLEGEGIDYEREKPLKYMAGWRYYDFCLIDYNVLIEVDGQYYHDTRGKPSYVIMMAKKNDAIKNWLAKKEGYNLIRIKEKELLEEYDGVKEKISLLVGKENL